MNNKDKKNQGDLFGFDPTGKEGLTSYESPQDKGINEFKKQQKEFKQQQKERNEEKELRQEKIARNREKVWQNWCALSIEEKLIRLNKKPFNSEEEILEQMNGFYSFKYIHESYGDGSYEDEYEWEQSNCFFFSYLRSFLLNGHVTSYPQNGHGYKRALQESFKNYYLKNKNSKTSMLELSVNVLSSIHFYELVDHLWQMGIKEKEWHKIYLKKYLKAYQEEAEFIQKFISSTIYDSNLKFSVSNKENKLKIIWKLDQSFIGSNGNNEREEAVWALFDLGNLVEYLGEFRMSIAPKVIRENIFDRHPLCMENAEEDKKKEYLTIEFWQLQGKNNRQICEAWDQNKIGKKTIKRGKRYISLEWEYPKSFKPYEVSLIRSNCESIFAEVSDYMHPEDSKEIMNMIRCSVGEFG